MQNTEMPCRLFLSAAEASGDRLCANLITALKQYPHQFEFVGFGGPRMQQAGCQILINTTQRAAMTYKAFSQILFFWSAVRQARRYFANQKVDFVVVCDSPSFNFHIARIAYKAGIPTLFYVAPQLWAWGQWRLAKLKRLATAGVACILPFEQEWFSSRAVQCTFVGSPMLENVALQQLKAKDYSSYLPGRAHIALMPGSRPSEVESLWPAMLEIATRLKARHTDICFTAVAADENILATLRRYPCKRLSIQFLVDAVYDVARRADFALVASGSATLQVAAAGCPMVIMYQSSKLLWETVGRRIVKTKYLSLVNILAQQQLVPEFMPYFTSVAPIVTTCEQLLYLPTKLAELSKQLIELVKPLAGKDASKNVADMIMAHFAAGDGKKS